MSNQCLTVDYIMSVGPLCGSMVRGVATGVYRDIYPPNQSTLNFLWLFCRLDPGQILYRAIYTPPPNQNPGYASVDGLVVSALGMRTRRPRFESRVTPLFH